MVREAAPVSRTGGAACSGWCTARTCPVEHAAGDHKEWRVANLLSRQRRMSSIPSFSPRHLPAEQINDVAKRYAARITVSCCCLGAVGQQTPEIGTSRMFKVNVVHLFPPGCRGGLEPPSLSACVIPGQRDALQIPIRQPAQALHHSSFPLFRPAPWLTLRSE